MNTNTVTVQVQGSAHGIRQTSVDAFKAAAIFAVVVVHASGLFKGPLAEPVGVILQDAARFAVPAFVVIWALFFERGYARSQQPVAYVRLRFRRLFVPYAFWTVVYVLILLLGGKSFAWRDLITGYWSGYGWAGQYYFIILFQLMVLFPALRRVSSTKSLLAVVILFLVLYGLSATYFWHLTIVAKLSDRLFIYWVPHVVLGVWLSRKDRPAGSNQAAQALIWLLVALVPIEFAILRAHGGVFGVYVTPTVLVAGLALAYAAVRSPPKPHGAVINFFARNVGERTLGVFCINPLVVTTLSFAMGGGIELPATVGWLGTAACILLTSAAVTFISLIGANLLARTALRSVVSG